MPEGILRLSPDQVNQMLKQGKMEIVSSPTPTPAERVPSSGNLIEFSKGLFGEDFYGPIEVETAFGIKLKPENIPGIPFTQEQLQKAKELDQTLRLRVDRTSSRPLTIQNMEALLQPKFEAGGHGKVLWPLDWYKREPCFTTEKPRAGWAFVGKEVVPNTTSADYLVQTQILRDYLQTQVFPTGMPSPYKQALEEFAREEATITGLMSSDSVEASKKLSELKLNQLMRQNAPEVVFDTMTTLLNNRGRDLQNIYTWTNSRASDGSLVCAGRFSSSGLDLDRDLPEGSNPGLGVVASQTV